MIFNLYPVILVNSYISCSRPFADSLKFSTVLLLFLVFKFTFYLKIIPKWKLQENMIVNFMSQLTGLRDAQITGKRIFLAMPVRMFLEETNIWFSRLSKKFATLTLWMDIIQSTGGLNGTRRQRNYKFSLLSWFGISTFCPGTPELWFSGLWTLGVTPVAPGQAFALKNWIITPAFLILQMEDRRGWANSYEKISSWGA